MRTIHAAAVQMDANPAPTAERLARAECLVTAAARKGAQLVVLPELFNTGYTYSSENYARAELQDGPSPSWMCSTARRLGIHLAGTLMLRDLDEIYNSLLLYAPDGRVWRYDKRCPWAWERAYYKPGKEVPPAQTDLGTIGMLVCWDAAHPALWRKYAGQVDFMLISSCPPDVSDPVYRFKNGAEIGLNQMGPLMARLKGMAPKIFEDMINQQCAWLGVAGIHTVGSGKICTSIPAARSSFLSVLLTAPWLIKYLPQAGSFQMECKITEGCRVILPNGETAARHFQTGGEGFCSAVVNLAETRPTPVNQQPKTTIGWLPYVLSDIVIPALVRPVYDRSVRRLFSA